VIAPGRSRTNERLKTANQSTFVLDRRGLAVDVALYGLSVVFAAITATSSTLEPHRAWGAVAVWGYAAATLAALTGRARLTVAGLTWAATTLLPLVLQARTGLAQEEVVVVEQAGQRLLDHGTPYLDRSAIAALPEVDRLLGYVPYQPGMALFGLPRAIAGTAVWWTDARVWFAAVTAAVLAAAIATLGRLELRAIQVVTVFPMAALTLATGGDDLPVLALCLLALALAARDRVGAAGVAVGAAAALKLFAWPVALVLAVHAATKRRLGWFAAGAFGLPVLALVPALIVDAGAVAENVLRFPLGRGLVTSPAQSPLPGYLIATTLPAGRAIAATLLVAAGGAIAVWLWRRPPRTAAEAAKICAYGLLAAILLMPSTRFGYLLYPVTLAIWVPALATAETVEAGIAPKTGAEAYT
jgi:hypothetical protein